MAQKNQCILFIVIIRLSFFLYLLELAKTYNIVSVIGTLLSLFSPAGLFARVRRQQNALPGVQLLALLFT